MKTSYFCHRQRVQWPCITSSFQRQCSHFPPKHHANYTVEHLGADNTPNCDRSIAYNFRESWGQVRHKKRQNKIISADKPFIFVYKGRGRSCSLANTWIILEVSSQISLIALRTWCWYRKSICYAGSHWNWCCLHASRPKWVSEVLINGRQYKPACQSTMELQSTGANPLAFRQKVTSNWLIWDPRSSNALPINCIIKQAGINAKKSLCKPVRLMNAPEHTFSISV